MAACKAYLDLCRVSNLPTVWTNVLAASLLATGQFPVAPYLLLALALSLFYMGGMSLNDVCDLRFDRRARPSRPIPSGRISARAALVFSAALFAAGLLLVGLAPRIEGLAAALLLLAVIVAYDLHHKGNPYSVLLMAACRLLVFVVTALALTGQLPAAVLAAGMAQFAYVVAISLVARREQARGRPYAFPVIPAMLAGIALLDGVVMAILVAPPWLAAGVAAALMTWVGQRFVRGD